MSTYRLTGTLRGTDLREAWIIDGKIAHDGPDDAIDISGYVYPGLLDTHTHPGLNRDGDRLADGEVQRRLRAHRAAGVTAIQDCGGQQNPNDSRIAGLPRVLHCGQHIAQPKRYPRYLASEIEPNDLVAEVLRQLENSDGWVKLIGDWIDRDAGDLHPLWERDVLIDAVQALHGAGGKITVHTFASETVDDLLEAGVDGIEHGTGMTRDHLIEARDRGILLTPTVHQVSRFPEFAEQGAKFPAYAQRMLAMDAQRVEHLAMMVDVGSHFLMGSDTAEDVEDVTLVDEILDAVRDGMPSDVVMAAASWQGRERLGFPSWEEGAPADFVVYDDDPERRIEILRTPVAVFIDGENYC